MQKELYQFADQFRVQPTPSCSLILTPEPNLQPPASWRCRGFAFARGTWLWCVHVTYQWNA